MAKKTKISKGVNKSEISGKISFYELVNRYPESANILMKHGMSCIGCPMAMQESLEQGCKAHGIDSKKLIEEIKKAISKKKR
jgi:hybrid cluster-associated redox disulfide protein